jgi:tetratricopeptide (TPR) repeat protein
VFIPIRTIPLCILVLSELTALGGFATTQGPTDEQLYDEANGAYDRGDVLRAISLYQLAIALQSDSVPARTNLAVALAHDGRYQEAIAQYQEALERDPKNSMVRLNLALARFKQPEFEKAFVELESLRKEHPDSRPSLYLLADCYLGLGKNSDVCHQDVRRKSQPEATNIRLECSGEAPPKQHGQM